MDKFRLLRICGRPQKVTKRLEPKLLLYYMLAIFILATLVSFPNALIFITVGFGLDDCITFN
jgi:hypothetical protein